MLLYDKIYTSIYAYQVSYRLRYPVAGPGDDPLPTCHPQNHQELVDLPQLKHPPILIQMIYRRINTYTILVTISV